MIPVNIRLFDFERVCDSNDKFNQEKYMHLLHNDEILKLRVSMTKEKLYAYLDELKNYVKGKQDLTEIVSFDKIYNYKFPIQIERVGKYRLKGNLRKTENVVIPNSNLQYNNLFYYLCKVYEEEIDKDSISFIDTDLILLKYHKYNKMFNRKDIIDRIVNDLNVEILSSYSYSEVSNVLSKLKYFSQKEKLNIESNKLNEIELEAVNNQELFEDLGIKIEKEKQKIKN